MVFSYVQYGKRGCRVPGRVYPPGVLLTTKFDFSMSKKGGFGRIVVLIRSLSHLPLSSYLNFVCRRERVNLTPTMWDEESLIWLESFLLIRPCQTFEIS